MKVTSYKDWYADNPVVPESQYREMLLEDVNKMSVFAERLTFHREEDYIIWEDQKRVKHYFIIDHEDDLNGKWLKYVWDINYHKKQVFLKHVQSYIDDIGRRDWYGRPKLSLEDIKSMCQKLFDIAKEFIKDEHID